MTKELNTLSTKKYTADFSGSAPTLDSTNGIRIADVAIDSNVSSSTNIWECQSNAAGSSIWVRMDKSPDGQVYVAKNGDDTDGDGSYLKPYLTIKAALASITDNDSDNRYTVNIAPGIYTEANPVTLKAYVSIIGQGLVEVKPSNNSLDLFTAVSLSEISEMTLNGPVTTGSSVDFSVAGSFASHGITILDSDVGFLINHASADVHLHHCYGETSADTIDKLIEVQAGNVHIDGLDISEGSEITNLLSADGVTSSIVGNGITSLNYNVTDAISVTDNARVNLDTLKISGSPISGNIDSGIYVNNATASVTGCSIGFADKGVDIINGGGFYGTSPIFYDCSTAVNVGSGACVVEMAGALIEDSDNYDLYVGSPDAEVEIVGSEMNDSKYYANASANVLTATLDNTEGDAGFKIKGELNVGTPEAPSESVFGQGDSYTRGMLVYQYDSAGDNYVDVSEAARSASGSTFTFQGVQQNDAIYVASDLEYNETKVTHHGIKVNVVTAANVGSNDIITEYWDGDSWEEVNTMTTDSGGTYYPHAKELFQQTGSKQVRYNAQLAEDNWGANDPPSTGTNRYWIRFRITDTIITAPVFQQFKLHTSRSEINDDGFKEFFGTARPIGVLPWHVGLLSRNTAMGDQNLYISQNMANLLQYNVWNTNGDQAHFVGSLPLDLDTSSPLILLWSVRPAATGSTTFTVRWAWSTDGDTLYTTSGAAPATASNEQSVTSIQSTTAGEQITFFAPLDVSDMVARREGGSEDTLWVVIERTSSSGNVALNNIDPRYFKWNDGGHTTT